MVLLLPFCCAVCVTTGLCQVWCQSDNLQAKNDLTSCSMRSLPVLWRHLLLSDVTSGTPMLLIMCYYRPVPNLMIIGQILLKKELTSGFMTSFPVVLLLPCVSLRSVPSLVTFQQFPSKNSHHFRFEEVTSGSVTSLPILWRHFRYSYFVFKVLLWACGKFGGN